MPLGRGVLDFSVDFWIVLMNVWSAEKCKLYIIPQEDIAQAIDECARKEANAPGFVIWNRNRKKPEVKNHWMSNTFLLSGSHAYSDAWDSLK